MTTYQGTHLAPTEQRLMAMMADGLPHLKKELLTCLDDPLSDCSVLKSWMCKLRAKLRPLGEDIVAQHERKRTLYRRVRLLNGAE